MKVEVEMLGFMDGEIRVVEIPQESYADTDDLLNDVWKFGQNDVQPVEGRCSVSMGDVIRLGEDRYMPVTFGFLKLTKEQYEAHKALPRRDRSFNAYTLRDEAEMSAEEYRKTAFH